MEDQKTVSVRLVDVPQARNALFEAKRLIEKWAEDEDARAWLNRLPEVLNGSPQRHEVGDLVEYDVDGKTAPGVIVASVICHEQYVVGPGDDRTKVQGSMWMMHADQIRKRKQIS